MPNDLPPPEEIPLPPPPEDIPLPPPPEEVPLPPQPPSSSLPPLPRSSPPPSPSLPDLEKEMMKKVMGFTDFNSTKGKQVPNNNVGAVHVVKKRRYRQYMNRKGGFNRPLDKVA